MFKLALVILTNILFLLLGYKWFKTNIHYSALMDSFAHIEVKTLVISSIPLIISLSIYGLRTRLLLKQSFNNSFSINIIGHGLNNIFPFRLGELLKIILARKFYSISVQKLGLLTMLEKSFDLIVVSLLGLTVVYQLQITNKLWILILLFLVAITVIFFVFNEFNFKSSFFKNSYINLQIEKLNEAVTRFDLKKNILWVIFYSVLIWVLNVCQFYWFFSGNLPSHSISLTDAVTLLVITTLTFIIPVTPGSVGLFEGVIIYYLKNQYQLTTEKALALACMLHLAITIPQLLGLAMCLISQFIKNFMRSVNGNKKSIILAHNCDIN